MSKKSALPIEDRHHEKCLPKLEQDLLCKVVCKLECLNKDYEAGKFLDHCPIYHLNEMTKLVHQAHSILSFKK